MTEDKKKAEQEPGDSFYVVSKDVAEEDFKRILKAARVRPYRMTILGLQELYEQSKALIIDDIRAGTVIVGEQGFPTVKCEDHKGNELSLTFQRRIFGGDLLAEDKFKNEQSQGCRQAQIGRLVGKGKETIETLDLEGLNACLRIQQLFRWARE